MPADPALSRRSRPRARGREGRAEAQYTGRRNRPRLRGQGRAALRLQDLFKPVRFAEKLRELLDCHNFVLEKYHGQPTVDFQTLDEALALAPRIAPLVTDVPRALYHANRAGKNLLFEGAQGALLDIDHGTCPSSSVSRRSFVAGAAAAGAGIGPHHLHYVLGITKAYTTRVGGGRPDRADTTSASACGSAARNSARRPAGRGAPAGSTPPR